MACHTPSIYDFDDVLEQKKFLRKRAKTALKDYCSDNALMESAAESVLNSVVNSKEYKNAPFFLGYMPMNDEVNIIPLMNRALCDNKAVYLPRMAKEGNQMDFFKITDFDSDFSCDNPYKIREPSLMCPKLDTNTLPDNSFICVPGLAFNLEGARLGRGKGYYDTFLQKIPNINSQVLCGVCFTICVTKGIPLEAHDFKVTHLLNEYGFVSCCRK